MDWWYLLTLEFAGPRPLRLPCPGLSLKELGVVRGVALMVWPAGAFMKAPEMLEKVCKT